MSAMVARARRGMSTYVSVVISPATTTSPVVISVSQATRPAGSAARTASRMASETWSATLSGWPSVTDSDVKRKLRSAMAGGYRRPPARRLLHLQQPAHPVLVALLRDVDHQWPERAQVVDEVVG